MNFCGLIRLLVELHLECRAGDGVLGLDPAGDGGEDGRLFESSSNDIDDIFVGKPDGELGQLLLASSWSQETGDIFSAILDPPGTLSEFMLS